MIKELIVKIEMLRREILLLKQRVEKLEKGQIKWQFGTK